MPLCTETNMTLVNLPYIKQAWRGLNKLIKWKTLMENLMIFLVLQVDRNWKFQISRPLLIKIFINFLKGINNKLSEGINIWKIEFCIGKQLFLNKIHKGYIWYIYLWYNCSSNPTVGNVFYNWWRILKNRRNTSKSYNKKKKKRTRTE